MPRITVDSAETSGAVKAGFIHKKSSVSITLITVAVEVFTSYLTKKIPDFF
jgi:hypothetical protein